MDGDVQIVIAVDPIRDGETGQEKGCRNNNKEETAHYLAIWGYSRRYFSPVPVLNRTMRSSG